MRRLTPTQIRHNIGHVFALSSHGNARARGDLRTRNSLMEFNLPRVHPVIQLQTQCPRDRFESCRAYSIPIPLYLSQLSEPSTYRSRPCRHILYVVGRLTRIRHDDELAFLLCLPLVELLFRDETQDAFDEPLPRSMSDPTRPRCANLIEVAI